jgi:hypothetical protein
MGTPIMWAKGIHLIFGNALIGLFEGLLIAFVFRVRPGRAVGLMVLANYLSAVVGYYTLPGFVQARAAESVYAVPRAVVWAMIIAFAATVVLEYPFVRLSFAGARRPWTRALLACLLVQSVSYLVLLLPGYRGISGWTFYSRTKLDPGLGFLNGRQEQLYYIAPDNGDLYRMTLGQRKPERVFRLGSNDDVEILLCEPEEGSDAWTIRTGPRAPEEAGVVRTMSVPALGAGDGSALAAPNWGQPLPTVDLRPDYARATAVEAGFWPIEGLRVSGPDGHLRQRFALETPFVAWMVRNVTILPGDVCVFQLGPYICALDLKTCRFGQICRGRGPIVLPALSKGGLAPPAGEDDGPALQEPEGAAPLERPHAGRGAAGQLGP